MATISRNAASGRGLLPDEQNAEIRHWTRVEKLEAFE
jgi:hypothetical protein